METIAMILADILFLALGAFLLTLDRRLARLEARLAEPPAPPEAETRADSPDFGAALAALMSYGADLGKEVER